MNATTVLAAVSAPPLPAAAQRWPAEEQLLVQLLRAALQTAPATLEPPATDGLDARRLIGAIRRHRVAPFLHRNLPLETRAALPPAAARALAADAAVNARGALRRTAGMVEVVRVLQVAGVSAVSLKGPLLARELHGSLEARAGKDIDLWIGTAEAEKADAAMRAAGFVRARPPNCLTARQSRAFRAAWPEFEYHRGDEAGPVELIWRLSNHALFDRAARGEPLRTVPVAGENIALLSAEAEALYLLLHGAFHGWLRHFWLVDIAVLLRRDSVDWRRVAAMARACHLERPLWQGLRLARELLGAPLPGELSPPSGGRVIDRLVNGAYRHMALTVEEYRFGSSHVWMARYQWDLQAWWPARFAEWRQRWVNPADWEMLPLPDWAFAGYYLLWPVLWLLRQLTKKRVATKPAAPARLLS